MAKRQHQTLAGGQSPGLGGLLGGGGAHGLGKATKHIPWWLKLAALAFLLLLTWFLTMDAGVFLVVALLGFVIGWMCLQDYRAGALALVVFLLASILSGTKLGPSMQQTTNGVKSLGPVATEAIADGVREMWPDGEVNITPPPVDPGIPVTTVATTAPAQPVPAAVTP